MIPDSIQGAVARVHGNHSTFPGTTTSHGKASDVSCDALCEPSMIQPQPGAAWILPPRSHPKMDLRSGDEMERRARAKRSEKTTRLRQRMRVRRGMEEMAAGSWIGAIDWRAERWRCPDEGVALGDPCRVPGIHTSLSPKVSG
jgi:hypothetical protein